MTLWRLFLDNWRWRREERRARAIEVHLYDHIEEIGRARE